MSKQFGAIYLILGTCVAAGMLGLPVVTAQYHFFVTTLLILSAWLIMTAGAWCLLQVNFWMHSGANLISMSEATLGKAVKYITWVVYLLLLYSLICAYLAAAGDLLHTLLGNTDIPVPRGLATLLAVIILGGVVLHGIRSVDYVNRFLMSAKLLICLLLIVAVAPHVQLSHLSEGKLHHVGVWDAWLVIVCAFGYAIILPTIRSYVGENKKQLTRIVMIGSVTPMVLYFIWVAVIQGALPRLGANGLVAMNGSPNTNSLLMHQLIVLTHYDLLRTLSVIFISICSITGFLGVSICLVDFLSDGLKREKQGRNQVLLGILTFLPPTLIVIFDPSIFTKALAWAGGCCLYILVLLPIGMYVFGRYKYI